MNISEFTTILNDKHFCNLKKLKYKYPVLFDEFLSEFKKLYLKPIELLDFNGDNVVTSQLSAINNKSVKLLLKEQKKRYSIKAATEEIASTSAIESIDFNRESIKSILKGIAPRDEQEVRILGQKKGLDFISNSSNKITEENIYKLYMMTVGDFLADESKLSAGSFYRDGEVFVVSDKLEHSGLDYKKLPQYMKSLVEFINSDNIEDDLAKAAVIHFYFAYLHPYFDGNGRMARLLHLWFLIQKGYHTTLFVPFSSYIQETRSDYYNAFTLVEENSRISGVLDVTPFVKYFAENVYNKMPEKEMADNTFSEYKEHLMKGEITDKEASLWAFVVSFYGNEEFSTKQLEKEYSDVAYATIRKFVLKFESWGLLSSRKAGNRVRYRIIN
jgi:Fic family protein